MGWSLRIGCASSTPSKSCNRQAHACPLRRRTGVRRLAEVPSPRPRASAIGPVTSTEGRSDRGSRLSLPPACQDGRSIGCHAPRYRSQSHPQSGQLDLGPLRLRGRIWTQLSPRRQTIDLAGPETARVVLPHMSADRYECHLRDLRISLNRLIQVSSGSPSRLRKSSGAAVRRSLPQITIPPSC